MLNDDMALVRAYAHGDSEAASTELVARHVNLVYSVALRQVREPRLTEKVTQAVFIILARKAAMLGDRTVVAGWLCLIARYASADALKQQRRRQRRESEAYMQPASHEPVPDLWPSSSPCWTTGWPIWASEITTPSCSATWRIKKLGEVGRALGTNEDAAKMRVNRALEKLRKFFANRGLTLSATALAPAGNSTLHLVKAALKLMAWTKVNVAIMVVWMASGGQASRPTPESRLTTVNRQWVV